jgi:hypothetical protein
VVWQLAQDSAFNIAVKLSLPTSRERKRRIKLANSANKEMITFENSFSFWNFSMIFVCTLLPAEGVAAK